MVEAHWAPRSDADPLAPPGVYPEFDGGYPSFLNNNRHRNNSNGHGHSGHSNGHHSHHKAHSSGHSSDGRGGHGHGHPHTYGHHEARAQRNSLPNAMGRSQSHDQLNKHAAYPPGIIVSPPHVQRSSRPAFPFPAGSSPSVMSTPPHSRTPHSAHSAPPPRSNTYPSPASPTPHTPSPFHNIATPTTTSSPASALTAITSDTARPPRVRTNSMPPQELSPLVLPVIQHSASVDAAIPSSFIDATRKPLPTALPPPEGRPWVHDPARPTFLPPVCNSTPTPLTLLNDTLDIARDYREFVDTVGHLELEYGRALQGAVRKLQLRLDAVNTPLPGGRKPPATTLTDGMRAHLAEMTTVANLYMKRPNALSSQLGQPLSKLDRRGGESTRRLGAWSKDIRQRWEEGRQRVDNARTKYDNAVRDHHTAEVKLRQCTPPELSSAPHVGSEWLKMEKTVAELERARADRKRAYVVAVAGEGTGGGGGRDIAEGGGPGGWGEEARQLYGHVQNTMLELLRHHVEEDSAHYKLLGNVMGRVEDTYSIVDLVKDQDTFLDWNGAGVMADEPGSISQASTPGLSESSSTEPASCDSSHPSLQCYEFIPPPWASAETAVLDTARRDDRNWLVNRWLISSTELNSLTDGFSKGILVTKRDELARTRQSCLDFAANRGLGDPEEVWEKRMNVLRDLGIVERRVVVTKAEMACLEEVLGPNPRPEMTHDFKDRAFATPSPCDTCKEKVWSPIKSELACRHCGIALHKACALHVNPECTGLKSRRRTFSNGGTGRIRRSITSGALKLRRATMYEPPHGGPQEVRAGTPALGRVRVEPLRDDEAIISPFVVASTEEDRAAVLEALAPDVPAIAQLARVRYTYPADGVLELSVATGEIVRVVEPDLDGSGWAKVRRGFEDEAAPLSGPSSAAASSEGVGQGRGKTTDDEGLVPLYVLAPVGESTAPLDGGCGMFVSAAFTFPPPSHPLGRGEVAIQKGAMYELTSEGMAFDELWCELLVPAPDGGVRVKGVVPKTYVKMVEL